MDRSLTYLFARGKNLAKWLSQNRRNLRFLRCLRASACPHRRSVASVSVTFRRGRTRQHRSWKKLKNDFPLIPFTSPARLFTCAISKDIQSVWDHPYITFKIKRSCCIVKVVISKTQYALWNSDIFNFRYWSEMGYQNRSSDCLNKTWYFLLQNQVTRKKIRNFSSKLFSKNVSIVILNSTDYWIVGKYIDNWCHLWWFWPRHVVKGMTFSNIQQVLVDGRCLLNSKQKTLKSAIIILFSCEATSAPHQRVDSGASNVQFVIIIRSSEVKPLFCIFTKLLPLKMSSAFRDQIASRTLWIMSLVIESILSIIHLNHRIPSSLIIICGEE